MTGSDAIHVFDGAEESRGVLGNLDFLVNSHRFCILLNRIFFVDCTGFYECFLDLVTVLSQIIFINYKFLGFGTTPLVYILNLDLIQRQRYLERILGVDLVVNRKVGVLEINWDDSQVLESLARHGFSLHVFVTTRLPVFRTCKGSD